MKLTNGEIFNARVPLSKLLQEKFPVKVSYGLAKTAQKLEEQLKVINQVREGLFKTYGSPDPQNPTQIVVPPLTEQRDGKGNVVNDDAGNPIMLPNPKQPKFMEEITELMEQETEVVIDVVTLPEALEVEPAILMALDKFVKVA